ncbi:hypothetical protein M0802_008326 [Mischocyttarus mexicanus]|nr:hypothetical protein M0802_008326 [Mischocyttarus mexicanus]KAI4496657.1 hypothetical protein M0804_000467 [Polistes exclamans]
MLTIVRIRERGAPPPPPPATSASSNVHLRKSVLDRGTNPLAPDAVDLTQLTSVSEWLASIKMSRYAESFERAGVTTLEAAARVTVQELTALGITLVGHQKKIMNSVTALRAQMSATSQSFLV